MLVKTNRKTASGKMIYQDAITGKEGVISSHEAVPSQRYFKRHQVTSTKVQTNRKATKGRLIHYQVIACCKEHPAKTIKHIQETSKAVDRKTKLLQFMDRVERNKKKWHKSHTEYQRKTS